MHNFGSVICCYTHTLIAEIQKAATGSTSEGLYSSPGERVPAARWGWAQDDILSLHCHCHFKGSFTLVIFHSALHHTSFQANNRREAVDLDRDRYQEILALSSGIHDYCKFASMFSSRSEPESYTEEIFCRQNLSSNGVPRLTMWISSFQSIRTLIRQS